MSIAKSFLVVPRSVVAAILATLVAACGGGSDGGAVDGGAAPVQPGSAAVGPAGGAVVSADGKVTLTIPAGALGNTETIRIESIEPAKLPPALADAQVAYDLKPDGLRFMQPIQVALVASDAARQADGSVGVDIGALVTASAGVPELLGDPAIQVNGGANTITYTGTLTHFSPLVSMSKLTTRSGIEIGAPGTVRAKLRPLPDRIPVGAARRAFIDMYVEGFTENEIVIVGPAYKDDSRFPLAHKEDKALKVEGGFRDLGIYELGKAASARELSGFGLYVCESSGTGTFNVDLKVRTNVYLALVRSQLVLENIRLGFTDFKHECVVEQAPPPAPPAGGSGVYQLDRRFLEDQEIITALYFTAGFDIFGLGDTDATYAALASTNPGLHIVDLTKGSIVRSKDLPGMPMYGVVPHIKDGLGCLFGYGSTSARTCYDRSIGDFTATEIGINRGPFTDAGVTSPATVTTASGARHLLWHVENGKVRQEVQPNGAGTEVQERLLDPGVGASRGWYANGGTPTGKAQSAFFNANGDRVLVARGAPGGAGQLWFGNPAEIAGGTLVGSLGANSNDTRKIRCVLPVCAVSNFAGNVTIVTWDGMNAPAIIGSIPDTSGAVTISVSAEGANRSVLSTDYNNNTVTKTLVSGTGAIISSVKKPVPAGCANPGHVKSFVESGQLKTSVSCNGVNAQDQSAVAVLTDSVFFAP